MPLKTLRPSSLFKSPRAVPYVNHCPRRTIAASPPRPPPKDTRSRLRRLNDRLPRAVRSYTTPLLGAPITHVTSFLILHEITAILPLFGLVAVFHYGNWIPDLSSADSGGGAFDEGVKRLGRWLQRKGWVNDADLGAVVDDGGNLEGTSATDVAGDSESRAGAKGVRLVLEFATAYAITKALLPVRIVGSVWATPWFARAVVGPVGRTASRLLGRK